MLRSSVKRLHRVAPPGVMTVAALRMQHPVIHAHDLCFTYPRFGLKTHLSDAMPELVQAKKLTFEGVQDSNRQGVSAELSRAGDVFQGISASAGDNTSPAIWRELRCIEAAKIGLQPIARSPHLDRLTLKDLKSTLTAGKDQWDRTDLKSFDATCALVGAYAESMLRLLSNHHREFAGLDANHDIITKENAADSTPAASISASLTDALFLSPAQVIEIVDDLAAASIDLAKANAQNDTTVNSIRTTYLRLCALRGCLEIAATGDGEKARPIMEGPMRMRGPDEEYRALLQTLLGEVGQRMATGAWGANAIDEEARAKFEEALQLCYLHFPNQKPDGALEVTSGQVTMRDVFSTICMANAHHYLSIQKAKENDVVFAPGTHYSLSPFLWVPRPANSKAIVYGSSRTPCETVRAKKLAAASAERALKINRKLYDDRQNVKAAWLLRTLAMSYGELKDYIYANGLFNSSLKIMEQHYGKHSYEVADTLALQQQFQRRIGAEQEAEATLHALKATRAAIAEAEERIIS